MQVRESLFMCAQARARMLIYLRRAQVTKLGTGWVVKTFYLLALLFPSLDLQMKPFFEN